MAQINIEYVEKLYPVFTKPKRIKIVVGGRGSTKSTGVADYVAACMSQGQLWCCAREHQNSIEESVHRTLLDEISRLDMPGFDETKSGITHESGGRNFYRGLARNITSLKSTLSGVDGLWIEEGEDLSENTLRVLTASVRLNATDTQRAMAGEDVKMPEIIITMNRGSKADAVADKWLARAEPELERCGYYEDDTIMVVELNYTDMPQKWFELSGLEQERQDDEKNLSRAMYEHKWLGKYLETVDNALIQPEWVEACIDAHEKLNFDPVGIKAVSHDPSDEGDDDKGLCLRHGSVILDVIGEPKGDANEGMDWALDYAIRQEAKCFVWDGDGLGLSLKRQASDKLDNRNIRQVMFRGGMAADNPDAIYDPVESDGFGDRGMSNKEAFVNRRAQYYWMLRDRIYNTYVAVTTRKYTDPDTMISFSSDIQNLSKLKSELCRIPVKPNSNGRRQLMSKEEMLRNKIKSPNLADSVMMSLAITGKVKTQNVYVPPPIRPIGRNYGIRRHS